MITRFAPSPTGNLHIGSARSALFNYLITKKYSGKMFLRIEDTDKKRSTKEFEKNILDSLKWLEISHDGGIMRQSERGEIYEKYITKLIDDGFAYESKEEKNGDTNSVIRFKNPNKKITFKDIVRGEIVFDTEDLGDFVIARDKKTPLYHLAVVIDDYDMKITHIIRGEDHISNTPRQILLQKAIGATTPLYAHLPLVLAADKSKLSKRHGAVSVTEFRDMGYVPKAINNYLALLGWSPEESIRQEKNDIFSMDELIQNFSLERIQKGGAVFDYNKLKWINRHYIRKMNSKVLSSSIEKYIPERIKKLPQYSNERLQKVTPIFIERIDIFNDVEKISMAGELDYFFTEPEYSAKKLFWKDETNFIKTKERIEKIISLLNDVQENSFTPKKIKETLWEYATKEGRGFVLWPMRYSLSGSEKSPDPFILASLFGKKETLKRLTKAVNILSHV